jgi:putative transposase
VALQFIRPGKPVDNAYVESFNGRFRDECLDLHWFRCLSDDRRTIERWRIVYNTARPHRSAGRRPPADARRPTPAGRRPPAAYAAQLAADHPTALSGYKRT